MEKYWRKKDIGCVSGFKKTRDLRSEAGFKRNWVYRRQKHAALLRQNCDFACFSRENEKLFSLGQKKLNILILLVWNFQCSGSGSGSFLAYREDPNQLVRGPDPILTSSSIYSKKNLHLVCNFFMTFHLWRMVYMWYAPLKSKKQNT